MRYFHSMMKSTMKMRHFQPFSKQLYRKVEKERSRLKGLKAEHFSLCADIAQNEQQSSPQRSTILLLKGREPEQKLCCAKGNSHLCALHFRCKSTPPLLTLFNHVLLVSSLASIQNCEGQIWSSIRSRPLFAFLHNLMFHLLRQGGSIMQHIAAYRSTIEPIMITLMHKLMILHIPSSFLVFGGHIY